MNQREMFLKNLPADREKMVKIFAKHGGAPASVTAIAWQLKKARKIHVNKNGLWIKKRNAK